MPLCAGCFRRFLHEDRVDHGEHGMSLALSSVGQGIADEVATAALPARFSYFAGSGLEALVSVGNY